MLGEETPSMLGRSFELQALAALYLCGLQDHINRIATEDDEKLRAAADFLKTMPSAWAIELCREALGLHD